MSTTIENGLRIDIPIQDLIPALKGFRDRLMPEAKNMLRDAACQAVMEIALNKRVPLSCPEPTFPTGVKAKKPVFQDVSSVYIWANDYVCSWSRFSEQTDVRFDVKTECYVEVTLALFPDGDHTCLIPFGSSNLIRLFRGFPEMKDFCYWNCTDRPSDISEEEWQRRARFWNRVYLPEADGFLYRLLNIGQMDVSLLSAAVLDQYFAAARKDWVQSYATKTFSLDVMREIKQKNPKMTPAKVLFNTHECVLKEQAEGSERWKRLLHHWDNLIPKTASECLDVVLGKTV